MMTRTSFSLSIAAAAGALCLAGAAQATDGVPMPLGRPAPAPAVFLEYCLQEPRDCLAQDAPSAADVGDLRAQLADTFWRSVFDPGGAAAKPEDVRVAPVADIAPGAVDAPSAADAGRDAVARAAEPREIAYALDRSGWRRVERLNQRINRAVRHREDSAIYGQADVWRLPAEGIGDCEDFALAKRRALIEMGVPASALSLAIVRTRRGQEHAVLLLATQKGEVVLDNLNPRMTRWDRTGYRWILRQEPGRPMAWRTF